MARKIRELIKDLKSAGFEEVSGGTAIPGNPS
jgi:hypothetical protein